jgi:hypothetical protein
MRAPASTFRWSAGLFMALAAAVLFVCFAAGPGCSRKRGVEITMDGDVTIVHNPEQPSPEPGGPSKLFLKEDLVIGKATGPAGTIFATLDSLGVDDEENIWALDRKDTEIHVFDRNGGHLRSFGRRGQGPGELESPGGMFVRGDGTAAVLDQSAQRVVFYDGRGQFLRTVSTTMPRPQLGIKIDSRGSVYGVSVRPREWKFMTYRLYGYDREMVPLETLAEYEEPYDRGVINAVDNTLTFHLTRDDRLIWMTTAKYELHVLDPEGREIRRIVKDFLPLRVSASAREALLQEITGGQPLSPSLRIAFPEYYPPVDRFIGDEEGRLFVRTYERDGRGGVWFDAFDVDGRCVTRFLFPENERAVIVEKGKLYAIVKEDEGGSPLIKRYTMDWK